jgi:hypothetical protein
LSHFAASRRPKYESDWAASTTGTIVTATRTIDAATGAIAPLALRRPFRNAAPRPRREASRDIALQRPRAPRIESTGIAGSR